MFFRISIAILVLIALAGCGGKVEERVVPLEVNPTGLKVVPSDRIYVGVYPDFPESPVGGGWGQKIREFDVMVNRAPGIIVYQNDFVDGLVFPTPAVTEILAEGKTPLVRLMPRSIRGQNLGQDPVYTMEKFLSGTFDKELTAWCQAAKAVPKALMVEFGPEVNGEWYPWNGKWNGGAEKSYGDPTLFDGPERFRDTFRKVIRMCRAEGVENITWVFHVDTQPIPVNEAWNAMANYYPGDDYIDWIGVSTFGAQLPSHYWGTMFENIDDKWNELNALSPNRPFAILEAAVIERPGFPNDKAKWIEDGLRNLLNPKYRRIRMMNYWHELSHFGTEPQNFRLDSTPQALAAYNRMIANPAFAVGTQSRQF